MSSSWKPTSCSLFISSILCNFQTVQIRASFTIIMAKISVNSLLLLISKRCYRVAAENGRLGAAETAARKVVGESSVSGVGAKEKGFWMRDPKTGNWIPENHFGDIDVVDLRDKYLSNARNKLTQTKT